MLRPVVDARVRTSTGAWRAVALLLDAGADRTVFQASLLPVLAPLALPPAQAPRLAGVGGEAAAVFIQSTVAFLRDDGRRVTVGGPFGVFTDVASGDVSVLGRDVTNNFHVLYSYPHREVVLLASPHRCEIRSASA